MDMVWFSSRVLQQMCPKEVMQVASKVVPSVFGAPLFEL